MEAACSLLDPLEISRIFPVGPEGRADRAVEVRAPVPSCTTTQATKKQTWSAVKTEHRIPVAVAVAVRTSQVQEPEPTSETLLRPLGLTAVLVSSSFVIRQPAFAHPICRTSIQVSRRVQTVQTRRLCTIRRRAVVSHVRALLLFGTA